MSDVINFGEGGGIESSFTTRAKYYMLAFFKRIRKVIENIDLMFKIEHRVYCPPELLRPFWSRYQIDVAVIFPGYERYNIGIEIDGEVGHKHKLIDEYRDKYIYETHEIPVLRFQLDWFKRWIQKKDFSSTLDELVHQHKHFKISSLPKNPLIHYADKRRSELF